MTALIQTTRVTDCNPSRLAGPRLPIALIFSMAFIIGLGGALPHLFFSADLGQQTFFESAWDEAFYSIVISGNGAAWNDYPVRALMHLLMMVTGGPNFSFALWSDVLLPILVVLAAGSLTLTLTRFSIAVVPITFLLVFGSDTLSFNSSAIYPPQLIISYDLRGLPIELRRLVPDAFTTFLYIYRTPEPQLSLPLFFCYLAIVVRFLGLQQTRVFDWATLACATVISAASYVFFAAASLVAGGLALLSLVVVCRWRTAGGLFLILFASALLFIWLVVQTHSGEASATLFHSRLPMIAPSMIYGGLFAPWFAWTFRRELTHKPLLIFALLCLLVPFAALNQQVVTGLMVQTLNWERYVDYPFVVVGFLLFFARFRDRGLYQPICAAFYRAEGRIRMIWWPTSDNLAEPTNFFTFGIRRAGICITFLILTAGFVFRAQLESYRQFAFYNLRTVAYAQILDQIDVEQPLARRNVTLDDPSLDAQVRVRAHASGLIFRGYTDLVLALKEQTNSDTASGTGARPTQQWGFVHAARLGFSREAYEAELLREIDDEACWPHLMFHFSFLECAPYVSDFRLYAPEHMREKVPDIGRDYDRYLKTKQFSAEDIILSVKPLPNANAGGLELQSPVATLKLATRPGGFAPAMSVEVVAYEQRPAGENPNDHQSGKAR